MADKVGECIQILSAWGSTLEVVTPFGKAFLSEASTYRRYAVACSGDVEAAKKRILATLTWREEFLAPPLGCPVCISDTAMHCFHAIGTSAPTEAFPTGCVVVYACAARAKTNDSGHEVRHMVHTLETAWAAKGVTADRLCASLPPAHFSRAAHQQATSMLTTPTRRPLPHPTCAHFPFPAPVFFFFLSCPAKKKLGR